MALAEPSGGTRLVQVRAVSPGYPFYGAIESVPANAWSRVHTEAIVLVDPSLLVALDASVGDSLRLGQKMFQIAGTLGNVPGDAGITAVIGPRVYLSDNWLDATALLTFGSRAEYDVVLKLPAPLATTAAAKTMARDLRRSGRGKGLVPVKVQIVRMQLGGQVGRVIVPEQDVEGGRVFP